MDGALRGKVQVFAEENGISMPEAYGELLRLATTLGPEGAVGEDVDKFASDNDIEFEEAYKTIIDEGIDSLE